jgi:hypothetical protein
MLIQHPIWFSLWKSGKLEAGQISPTLKTGVVGRGNYCVCHHGHLISVCWTSASFLPPRLAPSDCSSPGICWQVPAVWEFCLARPACSLTRLDHWHYPRHASVRQTAWHIQVQYPIWKGANSGKKATLHWTGPVFLAQRDQLKWSTPEFFERTAFYLDKIFFLHEMKPISSYFVLFGCTNSNILTASMQSSAIQNKGMLLDSNPKLPMKNSNDALIRQVSKLQLYSIEM